MSEVGTKVILTAFGNKLVSKPIDWPMSRIGEDIWFVMDMEQPSYTSDYRGIKTFETSTVRARFQFTGGYSATKDTPALYRLVEVVK